MGNGAAVQGLLADPFDDPNAVAVKIAETQSDETDKQEGEVYQKMGVRLTYFLGEFIEKCGGSDKLIGLSTTDVSKQFLMPMTLDAYDSMVNVMKSENHPDVGPATVFISHAWMFKFLDVVAALKNHFEGNYDVIVWFDMFCNCQHGLDGSKPPPPFDWWCNTFKGAIKSFGHVVMVLAPWNDPIPFTRAWCLFELYGAAETKCKFEVALSQDEILSFLRSVGTDAKGSVSKMMTLIDCERSEAGSPADRDRIFEVVQKTVGFDHINKMVLDQLRKWMLEKLTKLTEQYANNECEDPVEKMNTLRVFRGALSDLNVLQGNLEIAEKLLKNEVNILLDYQIKSKDDSPATLMVRCDLNAAHALVMLERGNTTDSLSELQNVLDQRKYHLGKDDPKTLSTYLDIAKVYMHPKSAKSYEKYRDAPQMLNYCYEKYKDTLGNEHPNTIEAHYNLAYLDYMRSEDQNAIDKFMAVRDLQEKVYGINHIKTMETRSRIMEVFQRRKFYNRAVVINDGGELLFQKYMVKVGDTHPDTIRVAHFYALSCFGFAHKKDNEKTNLTPEEEIHWFKRGDNAMFKCITGSIKLLGADHKDVLERIKNLNKERKVIATLRKRYNL